MTTGRNIWEEFFDHHAPYYMDNAFTKNTVAEVDFLLEELNLQQGGRILDVGCGTGRHAIELAGRGFRVTGVDISAGMLSEAAKAAASAGVSVQWVHCDATKLALEEKFDAAVCLCEGAFGLLGTDEDPETHDRAILRNISTVLLPNAPLLMTTLNGYASIRKVIPEDVQSGRFDPVTMIEVVTEQVNTPEGTRTVLFRERRYIPPELVKLIESEGFTVEQIWGGTAGRWGRRKIDLDEVEVMIVARKP